MSARVVAVLDETLVGLELLCLVSPKLLRQGLDLNDMCNSVSEGDGERITQELHNYLDVKQQYEASVVHHTMGSIAQLAQLSDKLKSSFRVLNQFALKHPSFIDHLKHLQNTPDNTLSTSLIVHGGETRAGDAQSNEGGGEDDNAFQWLTELHADDHDHTWMQSLSVLSDYCGIAKQRMVAICNDTNGGASASSDHHELVSTSAGAAGMRKRVQELTDRHTKLQARFHEMTQVLREEQQSRHIQSSGANKQLTRLRNEIRELRETSQQQTEQMQSTAQCELDDLNNAHESTMLELNERIAQMDSELAKVRDENLQAETTVKKKVKIAEKRLHNKMHAYDEDMKALATNSLQLREHIENTRQRIAQLKDDTVKLREEREHYVEKILQPRLYQEDRLEKLMEATLVLQKTFTLWRSREKAKQKRQARKGLDRKRK